MRRKLNRLTSLLVAVTIMFSLLPMNFAAAETTFPDFPTGWSKPAMEAAVANGLISGYEDGTVRPKGNLTRAEMATIITKAFGAVTFGEISTFKDVKEGSWYYESISRAVKMGAIAGRSATEMAPNAAITRQEVFTILARVLVLSNEDTSSLNKFGDVSEIASWAAPSMAVLTERGYVNGDDRGNANPRDNITREEFAQLMYMAIRTYITERGTYTGNLDGITVIRVSGVTIKDANVTSDLVIGDGAGTGKVTIENVKVEKRLLVRGGAIAVIRDTELGENVVVNNVNGITYFDNYRDEPVFKGMIENTIAKFKERSTGGGGGSSSGGTTPTTKYTVRFFKGITDNDAYSLGETSVKSGEKVGVEDFPETDKYGDKGYEETAEVASVYENNEYVNVTKPKWWYLDENDNLVEFTAETVVNGDMDVYLLNKKFGLFFVFGKDKFSVSTAYNDNSRLIDSVKNLGESGKKYLKFIENNPNLAPDFYINAKDRIVEALEKSTLIKEEGGKKNIQVVDATFKISQFVKEDLANTMIKNYLHEVVKNPAELEEIIDMIDVAEFADQLGIDAIIDGMSNAEIASLMKDSKHKGKIIDFIITDLKKTDSYVMDAVVEYVRTNLGADTQAGKDLRKEVLTSSMLATFLANAKMKEKVTELIITESFIETALDNKEFRTVLVEAIMADDEFIDILLASKEFHDYIVDQLHKGDGHALATDVEALINNTGSAFRKHVLDIVKNSDEFEELFDDHPELKAVISEEFKWSMFVADENDFMKFVFKQSGVTGSYDFVSETEIEAEIATAYNALPAPAKYLITETYNDYANLTNQQKKEVYNYFYGNNEVKAAILDKAKISFNTYKTNIVNKIAEGKISEVTDPKALELIDTLLAQYVTKYIEQEELHSDATINAAISGVIEEILFGLISDLIHNGGDINGNGVIDSDGVESELSGMLGHIDAVKHQFVVDPTPDIVAKLKAVVKDYRDTHADDIKKVVEDNYSTLTDKLILMINPEHPNTVYGKVEEVLKNVAATIDSSLISDYVLSLDENSLRGKVSEFIDGISETFVKDNRDFIEDALKNLDLSAFVDKQIVLDYVAGLDNAGKDDFADKIFIGLKSNKDYSALMDGIFKKNSIVVTKSNLSMVKTISSVLRGLDFDSVVDFIASNATIKSLVDEYGKDFVKQYYNTMRTEYCDGLDAVIDEVYASADSGYKKAYSASFTLRVNPVEMLKKLYEKAKPKVIKKLEKADVYYNDNEYLKYLVEHDIIGALIEGDSSLANGDFTGYSLKSVEEYYDYLMSLLIVGDDAITWYGDRKNLSQEHFDALYDAMIDKAKRVQEQLDKILADFRATGELPDKIQSIVESVSKVNELITRFEPQINKMIDEYFASGIDVDKVVNSDKGQTAIDILLGMDKPVFTIDMLYDVFYKYDDDMQAKLKELIDSGKLKEAIDKFESTSFGELLGKNDNTKKLGEILDEIKNNGKVTSAFESIYDVLVVVAEEGIDVYKVKENVKESAGNLYTFTENEYAVSIGGVTVSVSRYYESPNTLPNELRG